MSQSIMFLFGYSIVLWSAFYAQSATSADAIISRGFDAGLSIGLLVVGLIVIGVYHWRYQKMTREDLQALAQSKDEKMDEYRDLALKQLEVTQEQVQTNRELRHTLELLTQKIDIENTRNNTQKDK